jgi:2-polyprenyl-3-methyl-5-hydroxy-6-metoxy-1,4-benzoquinol methylase
MSTAPTPGRDPSAPRDPRAVPTRAGPLTRLAFSLSYAWSRLAHKPDRRAEFEHKYQKYGDYFHYSASPYEALKYERTLAFAKTHRRAADSALEIACSVGVFTDMLVGEFAEIWATDISERAIEIAGDRVGAAPVTFRRADLASMALGRRFDVIFCAEMLMFIPETQADAAVDVLDAHLGEGGVLIEVSPQARASNRKFFYGWDKVLTRRFAMIARERHDDEKRPYEIVAYARP